MNPCPRCGSLRWTVFIGKVFGPMSLIYQMAKLMHDERKPGDSTYRDNVIVCDTCQEVTNREG